MSNKLVVLTNNVVLIGDATDTASGVLIAKPHSIQPTAEGLQIQPFLEQFTGQEWKEIEIKTEHILALTDAENNDVLTAYLQKISGIQLEDKKIII